MKSPTKSTRGKILRYTSDRFTVAFVLTVFGLQLYFWHAVSSVTAALLAIPMFGLCVMSACIHHNHQHVNVFRPRWLNRLFEMPLALQTGVGSYTWVLHHNLGHHLNYLEQRKGDVDESRWMRRDGTQMGRIEYTLHLFANHHLDVYKVGQKHPRLYRSYVLMHIPIVALLAGMFYVHPLNTLIMFVALPLAALIHTCSATYQHHSGLETEDHLCASRNRTSRWYNLLSQNLGYHTAHHMRPGLHWSELPSYHEKIRDNIPAAHIDPTFW
jgi:fatty acid desaturase